MKILLLGKNGQVGWELQRTLAPLGEVLACGRQELDLTEPDSIRSTVRSIKPDLIVNAAAYTAVDKAEKESELAMAINGIAPGILAEEASLLKAKLIHYSTDYVFDGTKTRSYTEADIPSPLNVYGKSKLAGEEAIQVTETPHLIFRTSWVYGLRGSNFLLTVLRMAGAKNQLTIVNDQLGAPTWCRMIAEATAQIIAKGALENEKSGLYHITAAGKTTWFDFCAAILEMTEDFSAQKVQLRAIKTVDYPVKAKRPHYSLLDNTLVYQSFHLRLPHWQESLKQVINDLRWRSNAE